MADEESPATVAAGAPAVAEWAAAVAAGAPAVAAGAATVGGAAAFVGAAQGCTRGDSIFSSSMVAADAPPSVSGFQVLSSDGHDMQLNAALAEGGASAIDIFFEICTTIMPIGQATR